MGSTRNFGRLTASVHSVQVKITAETSRKSVQPDELRKWFEGASTKVVLASHCPAAFCFCKRQLAVPSLVYNHISPTVCYTFNAHFYYKKHWGWQLKQKSTASNTHAQKLEYRDAYHQLNHLTQMAHPGIIKHH